MRRTFITGDTHSTTDLGKLLPTFWPAGNTLNKTDVLIIAGDWGAYFGPSKADKFYDKQLRNWYEKQPWTTVVVLGNHEDYNQISHLHKVEKFGSKVFEVSESVFVLQRGMVYTINGKTMWTMGGGLSIDKLYRKTNINWWEDEMPNWIELDMGIKTLLEVNGKVDYVVTHVAPQSYLKDILGWTYKHDPKYNDALSEYLDVIKQYHLKEYGMWYCGHYHQDLLCDKLTVLYKRIEEIK